MSLGLFDFSRWSKEPEALLRKKEALDSRLSANGWRPSRLILVNYWRFDYEVFHFVQGRLILRGANTTGKSTVLVSAITFALDMEKRRERLDTFGGQGRGMAYYLLGQPDATPESDFYHEERTGYVALEFARGDRTMTIGVGLFSTRNRPDLSVDSWGFIVTDGSRIGEDVDLIDAQRVPYTARELADVLEGRGRVLTRTTEYQEQVNRNLFGFDSLQGYEFLLSLLLQLRSPKLNKDTKPSMICDMLAESLPPLPTDLLDQVTQIINDIDLCLETVETTERYVDAVRAVDERQAAYYNQLAQKAAVHFLHANEERERAADRLAKTKERLVRLQSEYQGLLGQLEENEQASREARVALDVLERHEAFKDQRQLEALTHELARARQAEERAKRALDADLERRGTLEKRASDLREAWKKQLEETLKRLDGSIRAAEQADWPTARAQIEAARPDLEQMELERGGSTLDRFPMAALEGGAKARREALGEALAALDLVEKTQAEYDAARALVAHEEEALADADAESANAEGALDDERGRARDVVGAWYEACTVYKVDASARDEVDLALTRFGPESAHDAGHIVSPIVRAARNQERPFEAEERRLALERDTLKRERDALLSELKAWEAYKDPEPARRTDQQQARKVLHERGIRAIPLYLACDVRQGVPEQQAAVLEQTLEAAGILDALVVDESRLPEVESCLQEAGLGDTWLRPGESVAEADSLALVLEPLGSGEQKRDVGRALSRIQWFASSERLLAAEDGGGTSCATSVAPGAWRMGNVQGTLAPDPERPVRYLGELNRRAFREAEIARLEGEIEEIDRRIWDLEEAIDHAKRSVITLRREVETLELSPVWRVLNQVAARVKQARAWVATRRLQLQKVSEAAERVYRKLGAARAACEEALGKVPEARGRTAAGVRALERATAETIAACERVAASLVQHRELEKRWRESQADLGEVEARIHADRESYDIEKGRVQEIATRERVVRERLDALDVDIATLSAQVVALKEKLAELGKSREGLVLEQGRLTRTVQEMEERLEAQEAELQSRSGVERDRRRELGERLQAYPSLQSAFRSFSSEDVGAARELLKLRRSDDGRLLEMVERSVNEAMSELSSTFAEHRSLLVEYSPEFVQGAVSFRDRGERVAPYRLRAALESELLLNKRVLQEKESELYEEVILRDVAREIRGRIALAQAWCDDVNELLAGKRLSNGEALSIGWRPRPPDRTTGIDPRRAVELLSRDVQTLTDDEISELVEHFRRRVGDVRERYRRQSLEMSFAESLAAILDYRAWFRFSLHSKVPSEERRELTDLRFSARSGAEKSLAMFIPILTAVHAHYKAAGDGAPRLVGLDEAFAGVDEQNVREMFRFLVELDFSWIMTSEKLWGVGGALPGCSTYELVKGEGGVVAPIWFVWDGSELHDALSAEGLGRGA